MPFWTKWLKPKPRKEFIDRRNVQLVGGKPVPPDESHKKLDPKTGMQADYVVLTPEERAKGYVRPLRMMYTHLTCGNDTKMGFELAETYAVDPSFYTDTFCYHCRLHCPLHEFVWKGTTERVGS